MGWQVHGSDLLEWDGPDPQNVYAEPGGKQLPRVDGHLTTERGLALLVLVADCLPVALSDGDRAAMLHCGWRALAGGIIEKAVRALRRPAGRRRRPGHRRCCYEVGPEVLDEFEDVRGAADGRMLDLRARDRGAARRRRRHRGRAPRPAAPAATPTCSSRTAATTV